MNTKKGEKESGAASIAVMLLFLFSVIAIIPFTVPVTMANPETVTLYFKPSDCSLVPKCECNTTYMELWANVTGTSTLKGGQVAIHYDQSCMNITQHPVQNNPAGWGPNIFNAMSSWNANPNCHGYGYDMILFTFMSPQSNTHAMIANFTVHCNTTDCQYCNTSLNFTCGRTGCGTCPIEIINATDVNVYPADVNFINGTFECGKLFSDLIVERVDPQYIVANLTNKLFAKVTNIGRGPTVDTFNVSINITSNVTGQVYYHKTTSVDPLAAGASTDVENLEVALGAWMPIPVENITINVTADCDNDIDEGPAYQEANNSLIDYRYTTGGDCKNDTMLPETCYGYRGQNPMSTVYQGDGDVIYTVGDYKYKNTTVNFDIGGAGGDSNRVTGTTADIPDGAQIKRAALYVYHSWRDFDVYGYPDLGMEFTNGGGTFAVSEEANYTDWKGFSTKYTHYMFGTIVYNVTDYVTGNDTYTANITNPEWVPYQWMRGAVSGMALMVIYDDGDNMKCKIAHGADRVSTNYWGKGYILPGNPKRWVYYVTPEDATTNATFPAVNKSEVVEANLFTVTVDGVHYDYGNGTKEALKFNVGSWYEGAWSNEGMGNYNYPLGFNRSDVTAYIADDGETAYFQERDDSYKNGFTATFACLQTQEGMPKISVEPEHTIIQPQDEFDIDINVTPNGAPVYAVEYFLEYNSDYFWAETQNKGPFLGLYNQTHVEWNEIHNPTGSIHYGETRTVPGAVTDPGTLATVHFTAIGPRGATSDLNLTVVIIVNGELVPYDPVIIENGTLEISDNIPPTPIGLSKHQVNNVAKKYPCNTIICSCSYDENYPGKGGNITYIRWDFGDGQYGTSEGLPDVNNCSCKNHTYDSWQWAPFGTPPEQGGDYVDFDAWVTVTDDGCPEETSSANFSVNVQIAGDANGDGIVDILDAAFVGMHWNECCCDLGQCPCYPGPCNTAVSNCTENLWNTLQQDQADLNNDCNINVLDAMITGANWGYAAWL